MLDVNIVTDRLDGEAFDLVIATNVFIYYDVLEQALAMSNVEAMLKPGAFLLANFSAPNLTSLTIRPVETTTTLYARARTSTRTSSISSSGTKRTRIELRSGPLRGLLALALLAVSCSDRPAAPKPRPPSAGEGGPSTGADPTRDRARGGGVVHRPRP